MIPVLMKGKIVEVAPKVAELLVRDGRATYVDQTDDNDKRVASEPEESDESGGEGSDLSDE